MSLARVRIPVAMATLAVLAGLLTPSATATAQLAGAAPQPAAAQTVLPDGVLTGDWLTADHPTQAPPLSEVHKSAFASPELDEVVADIRAGRSVAPGITVRNDRVRVEVQVGRGDVAREIRSVGGTVVESLGGFALADVPAARLAELNLRPAVEFVRLPVRVDYPADVPEAADLAALMTSMRTGQRGQAILTKTNVAPWHAAGYTGTGVKIGIVDGFDGAKWSAAQAAGEIGAPAGVFCQRNGVACDVFAGASSHGVGVAEVVWDMAPGAQVYLASASTAMDLKAAVDYFKSQGVRIITRSLAAPYDGAGDGTGTMTSVATYAEQQGMAFFNSAGNSAGTATRQGGHLRFSYADADGDGFVEFTPGVELLPVQCPSGSALWLGLRWSDWAATSKTDYDLYFYDASVSTVLSSYTAYQTTSPPIEGAGANPCYNSSGTVYAGIKMFDPGSGAAGDVLQLMVNLGQLGYYNNAYSATQPISDSSSPGVASVGAVDPLSGVTIAPYSSQGPSEDGRIKPDLSAGSNMTSFTYATGFNGTSAATPVVAGAAAVLLQYNPALTPAQVVGQLKAWVAERGVAGADNEYGTGELLFPAPPAPVVPPTPVITVTGARVGVVGRTLTRKLPLRVGWTTSAPAQAVVVARSLNGGRFKNSVGVSGARSSVRMRVPVNKRTRFSISAGNAAGVFGPWYYTPNLVPKVFDDRHRRVKVTGGWKRIKFRGTYRGTLTATRSGRGQVRMKFRGYSISLVMTRSANSGAVKVFIDGRSKGRINLHSRKIGNRKIVKNFAVRPGRKHTISVVPLSRGPRGWVYLDGFVVLG